ncbi:TPA: MBL fold metallo-hydrolase [Stenotrophomonas maltophilia]
MIVGDFYEIDFLDVETKKSGDAITVRYELGGVRSIHIVDTGYQATGPGIVNHVLKHYQTDVVDHLVITHCDGDHTGGAVHLLENLKVKRLWMLRPWAYADELINRFEVGTVDGLRRRLRQIYWQLVEIETKANDLGVEISDPFQGSAIGPFKVLAPSRARFLDLIVDSEKTPESVQDAAATSSDRAFWAIRELLKRAARIVNAAWNVELFSSQETSAENEMSVVQWASLCGDKVLLTGDAGRGGLTEAINYAPYSGLVLPGFRRAQVPHHGSRRNLSTEIMDELFGPRLPSMVDKGQETWTAVCSSAKLDEAHPRLAVKRAFIHRGARFIATESRSIRSYGGDAPKRNDWTPVEGDPYPDSHEE